MITTLTSSFVAWKSSTIATASRCDWADIAAGPVCPLNLGIREIRIAEDFLEVELETLTFGGLRIIDGILRVPDVDASFCTNVFFLIDNGSTTLAGLTLPFFFSSTSTLASSSSFSSASSSSFCMSASFSELLALPIGSNGWRLLRGRGDNLVGDDEVDRCALSDVDSNSDGTRFSWAECAGLWGGGRGDGVRGPLGRSDEWRESERACRTEEVSDVDVEAFVGVTEPGRVWSREALESGLWR